MLENLRKWLITLVGLALFAGAVVGLTECDRGRQQAPVVRKVDTLLVHRTDTLRTIKDSLKVKIVYRDTGRVEYIHDTLDSIVPPIGNENICIAENQLRQCVKCQDSLIAYKSIVNIDSITIDSLGKLAKTVPEIEKPSITGRLKDLGTGVLIGIGLRSLL